MLALVSCCSELHRFFIAISRAAVNHDESAGTARDLLVMVCWLPGPGFIWESRWIGVLPTAAVCADGVCCWPYFVVVLVKWVAFWCTLHWPVAGADLGVGGVSDVEMLILYELWVEERLVLKKLYPDIGDLDAQFQCSLWSRH